ncbi:hypothetical protein QR680_018897 [Steinernema hermaphroditum]|uniref:non-specific serine/threonine protein kinase n=1 Tax=Steinernema hermaphroditum TaxID=289476 RepID=A0AA39HLP0_9BILA|nr:hypothetical protein QR680_018897 [Steinernema hermaphroditum]
MAGASTQQWDTAVADDDMRRMLASKEGLVVNNRFRVLSNIAHGSYGDIFVGVDLKNASRKVALKFEKTTPLSTYEAALNKESSKDYLMYECSIYGTLLHKETPGQADTVGFPKSYGTVKIGNIRVLILDLLGPSIGSLFRYCDRKFSIHTIVNIGVQLIERIRHVHKSGIIHRDLKLENMVMGVQEKSHILHLIDYGLSRRLTDKTRPVAQKKGRLVGTVKYMSINSHKMVEQSKRDDLESAGYVLVELLNGDLPWKGYCHSSFARSEVCEYVLRLKETANWERLCPYMAKFMSYVKSLKVDDEPDYDILIEWVKTIEVNVVAEIANFEKLERATSESHQTTSSADSGLFSDSDSSNDTFRKSPDGLSSCCSSSAQSLDGTEFNYRDDVSHRFNYYFGTTYTVDDYDTEQLFGRLDDESDSDVSRSFDRKVEHLIPRPERYIELYNGLPTFSWDLRRSSPKADHQYTKMFFRWTDHEEDGPFLASC